MRVIPYFKIVNYHKEIIGNDDLLTIEQLMNLVGTEISLATYLEKEDKIKNEYITFIKLREFANVGENVNIEKVIQHTSGSLQKYPWKELANSLKENGMFVPVIAERLVKGNKTWYMPLEGKHRVTATILIEPYDKDRLIPCLIVDRVKTITID